MSHIEASESQTSYPAITRDDSKDCLLDVQKHEESSRYLAQFKFTPKWKIVTSLVFGTLVLFGGIALTAVLIDREKGLHHLSATSGGNGSTIVTDTNMTFLYTNDFGGDWAWDPSDPFGRGGRAQDWSKRIPGLGEQVDEKDTWQWGKDIVRGVNLGGWLVTRPFITPTLYNKYYALTKDNEAHVVDEWSLSFAMGANLSTEMEEHYRTFITEQDFAQIAASGLNWVRISIGYWAIETWPGEPFLEGVSWKYFLKAIQWARKYGVRIFLQVEGLPGSQNGWDHSGKGGTVNLMNGIMGIANAQRAISYLRVFNEFLSRNEYKDVVPVLGIANDIRFSVIGRESIESFYKIVYDTLRRDAGFGEGKGPILVIQDGFQGVSLWEGFMPGADRLALDQHPLLAWSREDIRQRPCEWAVATNRSSAQFGITLGGEFSTGVNDCGMWVNGIDNPTLYANCSYWNNPESWDDTTIHSLREVTLASMDALQHWFYYTWKVRLLDSESSVGGRVMWDYQRGREGGWVPKDPRDAVGHCPLMSSFDGVYPASATGDSLGDSTATSIAETSPIPFPPTSVATPAGVNGTLMNWLPRLTPTGTLPVLEGAGASTSVIEGVYVPIPLCSYPNAWDAVGLPLPTAPCSGH
ncbi:glycoside hydrolase family 5 protein [Moniliophthora roreri MCA 2997]|uniref:glucan 1,3-beta-glucosidase n=1 Tax=Moniliophthora roreri (strain MCA 2997) TaxID=1381753 RepID=V2XBH6_MONRO|nr:glycoside hydrolase family 5 protein [Moniliophthora roreri MCA 2997]